VAEKMRNFETEKMVLQQKNAQLKQQIEQLEKTLQ
jgi:hypothetical protein